jgi:tRNA threonylcarbamoyladenosine biosynthesis protein TsaB
MILPILAFDTSAAHCAAALLSEGRLILRDEPMAKGQAERLMPMLEEVLAEGGIGWADLKALAVGTGPGNFTGVRIAVAAARGLALGLGIPAVGVTRLEALAYDLPRPLRVLEDARRGEVYVQDYSDDGPGQAWIARIEAIEPAACMTGGAAGPHALRPAMPIAEAIARIGAVRAATPQPRPAPFYLRGADAAPPSDPPPEALARLHALCFQTPPPWSEADFAGFVSDPLVFLLVEGDAGFLLGRSVADEAELLTLAVSPAARRRGLGRKLVARFLYQARLRGADRAFLEVAATNTIAIALYESAGFGPAGHRRGYYRTPAGERLDALVLARNLA